MQRTGKRERLEAPTEDRVLCPIQNIIKPVGLPYSEGIAKEDNQRRHSDFVIAIFFFFFARLGLLLLLLFASTMPPPPPLS